VRAFLRVLVVACATALVMTGLVQAAASAAETQARTVFNVYHSDSIANWEYRWGCGNTAPFVCSTFGGHVVFQIVVSNRPQPLAPVTINYAIDNLTAVHGVNYGGPRSGTLTIDAWPPGHNDVQLAIPIIDTGSVGAPNKTLRVRLTGSSVPGADLSDTEVGFIKSAGEIPRDCTPSRADAESFTTTCAGRPAGSQWRVFVTCLEGWRGFSRFGVTITGNGTSSATCAGTGLRFAYWGFHLIS
jgi:hypothetical protein